MKTIDLYTLEDRSVIFFMVIYSVLKIFWYNQISIIGEMERVVYKLYVEKINKY